MSYPSEFDANADELQKAVESMYRDYPHFNAVLESVLAEWYSDSGHVSDDRIYEKDEMRLPAEGRDPLREVKTAESATSSSHDFLGHYWWYDLKPGDIVHCADEQHNYHTLSVIRNDSAELCLRDHYSGIYSLWSVGDIMSYLAPKREMLKDKHPVDMRFL